ncbi:MAG: hypothetical protein DRR16_17790 [Candidatus Parabeggiatoa sp. nov. 3]|nr:MAG: hypothetical protein DRR00_08005 [Gammaproteobacteria bacterium]RKZ60627.1 MAG: hypothetical protein DRQ99_21755 [Gammaproteobacteria bacterium]RKZ83237.1 MAG: hypothetical protein DRR16_17790 [Gammaproteobacteria bacterium]
MRNTHKTSVGRTLVFLLIVLGALKYVSDSADDEYNSWFDKGYALAESGQFEQAIESYDKALQIQSNDHAAWNNRSLALFNLGRFKEALESKRRVGRATAQRSRGTLNPPIFNYCER